MKKAFALSLCVVFALSLLAVGAYAKNAPSKLSQQNNFREEPQLHMNPPELGGSMFQAAAVGTTVLGWWQYDTAAGAPDYTGWTKYDATTQIKYYWHVAGIGVNCDPITPIAGNKSMWCGQWTTGNPPWCGWANLPGYGNGWDQSLESTTGTVSSVSYTIEWDSEPGYDYTYVEWFDGLTWVADPAVNGASGSYTGAGGPQPEGPYANPFGASDVRFHFQSDGAWSDEDGLWDTGEGAVKVDNISVNGGAAETFEAAPCPNTSAGIWMATYPPGFGQFGSLYLGTAVVQEDKCRRVLSHMWGWFDNPLITNYTCGGWPNQGAVRYGPDANGLYMLNEIWSDPIAISGVGDEYILSFLTYRDLKLSSLVFYYWAVRTRAGIAACPTTWRNFNFVYYGAQKDWLRQAVQCGAFVSGADTHIEILLGAYDYCGVWGGVYGDCLCHSHSPLIDQTRLVRVETYGPQYTVRDIDQWQDNFPELGGITNTSYARCDEAIDVITSKQNNILPGDSCKLVVTAPQYAFNADNTGGRPGQAVYTFVSAQDRFGNIRPYAPGDGITPAAGVMQSPDVQAYATEPTPPNGFLRWPRSVQAELALGVPAGWYAYRMDRAYNAQGNLVKDTFCNDLMDLADGPYGPPYHPNENWPLNLGIFVPGDVIRYFHGAQDTNPIVARQWAFLTRDFHGQGQWFRTNTMMTALQSACEWSVLPDAGRLAGDAGDILLVDDADDRGGPAQAYFDWAFQYYGLTNRVDRFDVLGPSSVVGNSLGSRVHNIQNQIIGDPVQIYQKVLWNSTDLNRGLMGDGGPPPTGSSAEKSDDFLICWQFLNNSTDNPGWAYWGDDVVEDWSTLIGFNALQVNAIYMNHSFPVSGGDQSTVTGVTTPKVVPNPAPVPPGFLVPVETFFAWGGCAGVNDFDMITPIIAQPAHLYTNNGNPPTAVASVSQATPNAAGTIARFFLAGFGYNFIRDDDNVFPPDYVPHLKEILVWFENEIGDPTGIDPVAYENRLDNNYPNPFNPTTTIKYSVAERGLVTLKIYNVAGQLVRTLVNEEKAPLQGGFSVNWNGLNDYGQPVASGVYFYQLTAQNFSQTKKMVLLK